MQKVKVINILFVIVRNLLFIEQFDKVFHHIRYFLGTAANLTLYGHKPIRILYIPESFNATPVSSAHLAEPSFRICKALSKIVQL